MAQNISNMSQRFSKKSTARALFVEKGFEVDEICNVTGLDYDLIEEWITKEKWDKQRSSQSISQSEILNLLLAEFAEYLKGEPVIESVEERKTRINTIKTYNDTIKDIKGGGVTAAEAVELCMKLIKYLARSGFDLESLSDAMTDFLNEHFFV